MVKHQNPAIRMIEKILKQTGPGDHEFLIVPAYEPPLHERLDSLLPWEDGNAVPLPPPLICASLSMILDLRGSGGLVHRHVTIDADTTRGWRIHDGMLTPLSEAQIFNAYCTDPDTGEPKPPEPGVTYADAFWL